MWRPPKESAKSSLVRVIACSPTAMVVSLVQAASHGWFVATVPSYRSCHA